MAGSEKPSRRLAGSIIIAPMNSVAVLKKKCQFSHVISFIGTSERILFPAFCGPKVLGLEFDAVGYSSCRLQIR